MIILDRVGGKKHYGYGYRTGTVRPRAPIRSATGTGGRETTPVREAVVVSRHRSETDGGTDSVSNQRAHMSEW
ncbi:hypothetical protein C450_07682 [Halococcus salifodinae DSM 8989]|uniref:Uncharacterized protein n=1 Tax=Halococcus salifodinae DSM 8989 TaxID=1227456 RepID=M0N5I2_9EURY|nr:hypothetical protein C450_07682 [Halococcus salifodinae DSM 8989]